MKTHNTALAPTIHERADGSIREISGYAAVFYDGSPATEFRLSDKVVERVGRTAFDSMPEDVVAYFNHDRNLLLGRTRNSTLHLDIDKRGLKYSIPFDETDPDHQRLLPKIRRGDLSGSSFSFRIQRQNVTQDGPTIVRELEKVELVDVGPVVEPAYAGTSAEARAIVEDMQAIESRLRLLDMDDLLLERA